MPSPMQKNGETKQNKQTTFIWWDGKQMSLDSFRKLCFPKEGQEGGQK